jgi:hypothetical protein
MIENTRQIRRHDGPYFQRWRERTVKAFGGIMPERRDRTAEEA